MCEIKVSLAQNNPKTPLTLRTSHFLLKLKKDYIILNNFNKSAIILMFNSINLSDIDIFKKKGEDKNIRIKKYMF